MTAGKTALLNTNHPLKLKYLKMIHLTKAKNGFMVVTIAENGECLNSTEVLTSRANCHINILATMDNYNSDNHTHYQDDAFKKPRIYRIDIFGNRKATDFKPHPIYTPSKKSKKK
jgi:uncharacterized protein YegP (UPF0339 family)